MKKLFYYSLALILVIFLAGCQDSREPLDEQNDYISQYARVSYGHWERLNGNSKVYGCAEEFLAEVDLCVEEICEYLGIPAPMFPDDRLKINLVSTSGLNYYDGGARTIYLNNSHFQLGLPPLHHELTHFLVPTNSPSLSEGLAQLVQGKFGKDGSGGNSAYFNSRQYFAGAGYDSELVQQIGIPNGKYPPQGSDANKYFYILSHSFIKYLVECHGVEKFMLVFQAEKTLDKYEEVYGIGLEQLRAEWKDFVIGGGWLKQPME